MGWGHKADKSFCIETGKTIFDKRGAETARNKRWEEAHVGLRIYPCRFCGGWHLTSQVTEKEDRYNGHKKKYQFRRKGDKELVEIE